VEFFEVVLTED